MKRWRISLTKATPARLIGYVEAPDAESESLAAHGGSNAPTHHYRCNGRRHCDWLHGQDHHVPIRYRVPAWLVLISVVSAYDKMFNEKSNKRKDGRTYRK
jgi:hypothetical protein